MSGFTIGTLAKASGVKIPTIRFYEQIGLLPEAVRTASHRRIYDDRAISRLAFIKHARQLGFSVDAIRSLLGLTDRPEQSCRSAKLLAQDQLLAVEEKLTQLQALREELQKLVEQDCEGRVRNCRVIETLAAGSNHPHTEHRSGRRSGAQRGRLSHGGVA